MSRIKAGGGHLPGAPGRNRGERAEEQRGAGGLGGRQEGCSIEQGAHAAEGSKEEEARAGRRAARGTQYPVLVQYRYTCTAHYSPETMMMIDLGMVPVSNVSKLMEAPMVTAQQAQQARRAGSARRGAARRDRGRRACRNLLPTGGGTVGRQGSSAGEAWQGFLPLLFAALDTAAPGLAQPGLQLQPWTAAQLPCKFTHQRAWAP